MTRAMSFGLALIFFLTSGACKRRDRSRVQLIDEEVSALLPVVRMDDPRAFGQLLNGFHGLENGTWRWTTGRFSVLLYPPQDNARNGVVLQLKLAIPDKVIARLKSISLSAHVNGAPLAPETYKTAGEFLYSREVDSSLLAGDDATVQFQLDHWIPAGELESRELGVIVSMVGLTPK